MKMIYAEVTVTANGDDFVPSITTEAWANGPKKRSCTGSKSVLPGKRTRVTLVANTHRAVVRVAELTKHKLTREAKWQLVKDNFPIGALMNEETHIFDGSIFINKTGRYCFMMVALPKAIAVPISEMAIEKWNNVHRLARLDTTEHMIFRHFAREATLSKTTENPTPQWVICPQDLGFRILHINDDLPQGTYYISNESELCLAELERVWEAATPKHVVIMTRTSEDIDPEDQSADQWIWEFVQGRGADIESRTFCCPVCFV
ncbi:MAG: hypothetical protein FWC92_01085 [Defluviitaleaceae bacterium]|nr:hypothetical protein [Defluviitaleaceae bacterium]